MDNNNHLDDFEGSLNHSLDSDDSFQKAKEKVRSLKISKEENSP